MLEVIAGSAIGSPFVATRRAALVADDYESTFSSRLMYKDLALVPEARATPRSRCRSSRWSALVQGCIATGMGERDFMALLPRLRREAGLA